MGKYIITCLLIMLSGFVCVNATDRWGDSMINVISLQRPSNGLQICDTLCEIFSASEDNCNEAMALALKSNYYETLGKYDSAIACLTKAQQLFDDRCDSLIYCRILSNLTVVYLDLGEYRKVDSISRLVFNIWDDNWNDSKFLLASMNNRFVALFNLGEEVEAPKQLQSLKTAAIKYGNAEYIATANSNLGTLKAMNGDLDSASIFFRSAIKFSKKADIYENLFPLYSNLSGIEWYQRKVEPAKAYLDTAFFLAKERNDLQNISLIYLDRSMIDTSIGDWSSAFKNLSLYTVFSDSALSIEKLKTIAEIEEKYNAQKRKSQIQKLKIENLNAELSKERTTRTRNALYGIAGMIALLSLLLYNRARIIRRSRDHLEKKNEIINMERKRSDDLLENILPKDVAEELKTTGKSKPKHYENVTIIFADFKDFTTVAERMTADELVEELNVCFQAFDEIMVRNGIEKIKTIGDAYMAAVFFEGEHHEGARRATLAALEMQDFIKGRREELIRNQHKGFEMRIGVHSGSVVAGVVGQKKFQYDIWGDAVNTAARLETTSSPGKVNISKHTYDLIHTFDDFQFEHRGFVKAKNKGDMEMYFVKRNNE